MIKAISPPKNVKLTKNEHYKIYRTASGWAVTYYDGDDGNAYEKAEKGGRVRWFKVE